jgi:dTDP-4-dehydrorhamnose 3,5-epimerase-like enzyme
MPRLVTLFPEPDSPTVYRLDQAVLAREVDPQVLELEQGVRHQYLTLGSTTA